MGCCGSHPEPAAGGARAARAPPRPPPPPQPPQGADTKDAVHGDSATRAASGTPPRGSLGSASHPTATGHGSGSGHHPPGPGGAADDVDAAPPTCRCPTTGNTATAWVWVQTARRPATAAAQPLHPHPHDPVPQRLDFEAASPLSAGTSLPAAGWDDDGDDVGVASPGGPLAPRDDGAAVNVDADDTSAAAAVPMALAVAAGTPGAHLTPGMQYPVLTPDRAAVVACGDCGSEVVAVWLTTPAPGTDAADAMSGTRTNGGWAGGGYGAMDDISTQHTPGGGQRDVPHAPYATPNGSGRAGHKENQVGTWVMKCGGCSVGAGAGEGDVTAAPGAGISATTTPPRVAGVWRGGATHTDALVLRKDGVGSGSGLARPRQPALGTRGALSAVLSAAAAGLVLPPAATAAAAAPASPPPVRTAAEGTPSAAGAASACHSCGLARHPTPLTLQRTRDPPPTRTPPRMTSSGKHPRAVGAVLCVDVEAVPSPPPAPTAPSPMPTTQGTALGGGQPQLSISLFLDLDAAGGGVCPTVVIDGIAGAAGGGISSLGGTGSYMDAAAGAEDGGCREKRGATPAVDLTWRGWYYQLPCQGAGVRTPQTAADPNIAAKRREFLEVLDAAEADGGRELPVLLVAPAPTLAQPSPRAQRGSPAGSPRGAEASAPADAGAGGDGPGATATAKKGKKAKGAAIRKRSAAGGGGKGAQSDSGGVSAHCLVEDGKTLGVLVWDAPVAPKRGAKRKKRPVARKKRPAQREGRDTHDSSSPRDTGGVASENDLPIPGGAALELQTVMVKGVAVQVLKPVGT